MWSDESDSEDASAAIEIEPSDLKERFLWASRLGKVDIMKKILQQESCIVSHCDSEGYTALHLAASEGQLNSVKFLLSNKGCVDAQTIDGWTPLHCASRWNQADVARLLLCNGSDVNACSQGNLTPIHVAASEKNTRNVLIILLNEENIDLSIKTNAGDTALDLAVRFSCNAPLFDIAASHINVF